MPRPPRPTRPNHDAGCPRTQSGHDSDISGPVPTTPVGHRQSRSAYLLYPREKQCGSRPAHGPAPARRHLRNRPRSRRRSARAVAPESPALRWKEEPALARFQQTPTTPDESEKLVVGLGGVLLGQQSSHSEPTNALSLPDNLGSGAAAQHGPSGLRAVAGAASATSAAASSSPRKRAPRRRRGRPRPGRGMSPFALAGPAMPDGTKEKRLKDTLGLTPEGVCPASLRAALSEMCLAQADSTPWPVLRNRGGRPAVRGSRTPRAMIARGRAGAPRRVHAIAQARRASRQARP